VDICPCDHLAKKPSRLWSGFCLCERNHKEATEVSRGEDRDGTLCGTVFLFYPSICKHPLTEVWGQTARDWCAEGMSDSFIGSTSMVRNVKDAL